MATATLLERLHEMTESPWLEFGRQRKPITARQLSRLLKPYGVTSGTIRMDDGKTPKGYYLHAFDDAFSRYSGILSATTPQPAETLDI